MVNYIILIGNLIRVDLCYFTISILSFQFLIVGGKHFANQSTYIGRYILYITKYIYDIFLSLLNLFI